MHEIEPEPYEDDHGREGRLYWTIGYAKLSDGWCIAAKPQTCVFPPARDSAKEPIIKDHGYTVALLKAPRVIRVQAAPILEDLLNALSERVAAFVENIQDAKKLV